MKVEMFARSDIHHLECIVNAWLQEHKEIAISHITQSQDAGTEQEMGMVVICVWYT